MSTCLDVAKYILNKQGSMTAMKLQKLVYYAQAWSLVWDEKPLFNEKIEAWINGPVIPVLYEHHKGLYFLNAHDISKGNIDNLDENQIDTIDQVLKYYGDKNPQWLSDLTHMEEPWRIARKGLPDNIRGNQEITLESMMEYYSSLPPENI